MAVIYCLLVVANRIPSSIDPIALLLAELALPLRRHVRRRGVRSPQGLWPLDLSLFLQAFANFILQRQLYVVRSDVLPEPDLEITLERFYNQCPDNQTLWESLLHSVWPMSPEAEVRSRRQRRIQRRAVVTAHALGVPTGLTTTTDWSSCPRAPSSPAATSTEESLDNLIDSLIASSPATRSPTPPPSSPDIGAYHSLSGLPLSPVPEDNSNISDTDLTDEDLDTLRDIVDRYNEGMGTHLAPEVVLDGTPGRVTTPIPIRPIRRDDQDNSNTGSTIPASVSAFNLIPTHVVDLTQDSSQTQGNTEEDWDSDSQPTLVTSFRNVLRD